MATSFKKARRFLQKHTSPEVHKALRGIQSNSTYRSFLQNRAATKLRAAGEPVVITDVNTWSVRLARQLGDLVLGIIPLFGQTVPSPFKELSFEDLLLIRDKTFTVCHMEARTKTIVASRLNEMGIDPRRILYLGDPNGKRSGGLRQDTYDPLVGCTRIDDLPGIRLFGSGEGIRILTLGGSTTDPTFGNLRCWSEYLYDYLSDMKIEASIYCAGMLTYVSGQEMTKLLRDGLLLKPDLVISYSGFNDAAGLYLEKDHPFFQKGTLTRTEKLIRKFPITNPWQHAYRMRKVTLGLADHSAAFELWLRNEHIMHGICREFGIDFHGVLQPMRFIDKTSRGTFYGDAAALDWETDWLHDWTTLIPDDSPLYMDGGHVYEAGNRLIARKMLPFVLEALNRG